MAAVSVEGEVVDLGECLKPENVMRPQAADHLQGIKWLRREVRKRIESKLTSGAEARREAAASEAPLVCTSGLKRRSRRRKSTRS